jgi:glycerophosphoryl diester phosphodiesterase
MKKKMIFIFLGLLILYIASIFTPFLTAPFKRTVVMNRSEFCLIGHRGAGDLAPENSIAAFKKGIEHKVDMIECDIHFSKDSVIVVNHDCTIDRTSNGEGKIETYTFEELEQFKLKDKNDLITEQSFPSLNRVINTAKNKCKILIEIKHFGKGYEHIEDSLCMLLEKEQMIEDVVVQSFSDDVLFKIHAINPNIKLEKLFFFKFPGLPFIFDGDIRAFNKEKYSFIQSFNIFYGATSASLIKKIHAMGKQVKIWTIDNPTNLKVKVDGIITNRPDLWKN